MFKPGDQPIAGYKLIHFLGKGQFGEVWKASGPGGTEVALKFILLQQRTGIRELKSIQSVKLIRHANLLPVHAIWLLGMDGTVLDDAMLDQLLSDKPLPEGTMALDVTQTLDNPQYLVVSMALADKSLEDLLKESADDEGISRSELLDFMRQAAKGIDFLNSPRHLVNGQKVGIQHRDIKPANLLVSGDSLLIGDFGVAAAFGEYDTEATSVVGSLCYMSPESIKRMPSHSSDQYALAITYYQLRANALPFEKTVSFAELVEIHIGGKLDFSRASAHEQAVLSRATSTDPKKRYATCAEFIANLEGAVAEAQPVAPRRRAAVTGAILVMAAIAATVAYLSEGSIWHLGDGNERDVTTPQPVTHKLTFEPPGTRFIIHLLGDSEEPTEPIEGQDTALLTLRDDQRISVDAALPGSLYLPLQEAYSVEDLRSKAWSLTLPRKEPAAIRAEAETALREGDDAKAVRLYRLGLDAMPDEFRTAALFESKIDSEPAFRASGGASGLSHFLSSGEGKGWLNRLIPPNEKDGWQLDNVSWGPLPSAYIVHAESRMMIEIHDRDVQVNDPKTGRPQQTLDLGLPVPEIPHPQILSHAISADQRWLLLGQDDGRVRLASISPSDAKLELVAEVALPQSVMTIVPFEQYALAVDRGGNTTLLPLPAEPNDQESITAYEQSTPISLELNQEEILGAIAITDSASFLVTEKQVYRINVDGTPSSLQATPVMEIRGYPHLIRQLPDGRVAITTDLPNRALAILGGDQEQPIWLRSPEIGGVVEDLTHSPDGRWMVLSDQAGELMAIDLQAAAYKPVSLRQPDRRRIMFVGFHDDSNILVTVFESGEIECWDFPNLLLSAMAQ